MDPTVGETAADFLARIDEEELAQVIRDYGEERHATRVARAIVEAQRSGLNPRGFQALLQVIEECRSFEVLHGDVDGSVEVAAAEKIVHLFGNAFDHMPGDLANESLALSQLDK